MQDSPSTFASSRLKSAAFQTSPEAIIPIPITKQTKKRSSRKKGKTVMSESPYKNELADAIALKASKEQERERKKKSLQGKCNKKTAKKSLFTESKCSNKSKMMVKKVSDSESEDDNEECLCCEEFYSVSNEGWIACQKCLKWVHDKCAGVDCEDDDDILVSEFCQQDK
ncbi:hypothetical protein MML48_9g00010905 [Holotrichia oblita]|uniref:Uncharacterized protein n=1 Tax=Holotrichia oblita TaxID=644536 RepID=A0ACB9SJS4_HOLOL|nr:hypothetical protein MML48_9g00010905 [Holotrichia oblita]